MGLLFDTGICLFPSPIPPLHLLSVADTVNLIKTCFLKDTLLSVLFLYPSIFLQIYFIYARVTVCGYVRVTRFPGARVAAGWELTAVGAESQMRFSARTTGTCCS